MDIDENLVWRKSTRSGTNGGDCVEVADTPGGVHMRDSKDPNGRMLSFDPAVWAAFVADVKAGKYDRRA